MLRARQALRLVNRDTLEWGTPVLYLRGSEGRIFDPASAAEQPVAAHQGTDTREVEALYDDALAAYWTERWDESVVLLQQVLARRADHPAAATKLKQATRQQQLAAQYHAGLHLLDAGQWQQAVEGLSRLDPSYRDTAALLARARKELAAQPLGPALRGTSATLWRPRLEQTVRHGDAVNAVAFSRDGRWLATASSEMVSATRR